MLSLSVGCLFLWAYFTSVNSVCDEVRTVKTTLCFSQSVIPSFCLYIPVVDAIDVLADTLFNGANVGYTPEGENRRGI